MQPKQGYPELPLPEMSLSGPDILDALLAWMPLEAIAPLPILLIAAPPIWWLFRGTWKELDQESRAYLSHHPETDYRPYVSLCLLAVTLTLHEYYGGRRFFEAVWSPLLRNLEGNGWHWIQFNRYGKLWGYVWWSGARVFGYVAVPLLVWRLLFPKDSVLDMGLRLKGLLSHLWIYGLCLVAVFGAMIVVARQPEFLNYYPFYKLSSRSWFDLLCWEALYFAQFFALEFYFRGWLLDSLRRTMGSTAIFVMAVPYCMIHYGKPYLEANGAILAGIVLGSLAMRTKSIYSGFFVHITVAAAMDGLALTLRHGLPSQFWP